MKSKVFSYVFLLTSVFSLQAQLSLPVEYCYDAAGNRTCRSVMELRSGNGVYHGEDTVTYSERFDQFDVNISPNPTHGVVHFECTEAKQEMTMRLFDSEGRHIQTNTVKEGVADIDLSLQPIGYYIIELICGDRKKTMKIVKL